MLISLCNDSLRLTVDTFGAQMMELYLADKQYLWQGDPAYWMDRAPILFPCIGRLPQDHYHFLGKEYTMGNHGFAAKSDFSVVSWEKTYLVLSLSSNAETIACYPFPFSLEVSYRLCDRTAEITYSVQNRGSRTMPFAIGAHPGFRVPWQEGESFEDYTLAFSQSCQPTRICTVSGPFLSGKEIPFPLQEGCFLPLRHGLFDDRVIILKNMAREVTLQSRKSGCAVTVSYPQMPYIGIWHTPGTDAPFVCIEPWSSLPNRENVVEEFSCKGDLIHLAPGQSYETTWCITISHAYERGIL